MKTYALHHKIPTLILTAFMLALSVSCASETKRESAGEYFDDTVITSKVKAALLDQPGLRSLQINVETYKGIVQLSGFVSIQMEIENAIAVTRTVAGVVSIRNDMRIR